MISPAQALAIARKSLAGRLLQSQKGPRHTPIASDQKLKLVVPAAVNRIRPPLLDNTKKVASV
jgi:hypothetical protein